MRYVTVRMLSMLSSRNTTTTASITQKADDQRRGNIGQDLTIASGHLAMQLVALGIELRNPPLHPSRFAAWQHKAALT